MALNGEILGHSHLNCSNYASGWIQGKALFPLRMLDKGLEPLLTTSASF